MDSLSLLCHATLVMDKPYFTNKPDRFKHQGLLAQDRPVINVPQLACLRWRCYIPLVDDAEYYKIEF
jgi:hypothetical protein